LRHARVSAGPAAEAQVVRHTRQSKIEDGMTELPVEITLDLKRVYEREYRELCENWTSLERKAQLSGGAAGALLAGVVAFLGNDRFNIPTHLYLLFPVIGVALFVSGAFALAALRVSDETMAPPGEKLREIAWDARSDDMTAWIAAYTPRAAHREVVMWDQACKDLHRSNGRKGASVRRAQLWLLVAAGVALLFVVLYGCNEFMRGIMIGA
jgi:hypothetical protein